MADQALTRPNPPPASAQATPVSGPKPASAVAPAIRPSAPGRRRSSYRPIILGNLVVVCLPTLLAIIYYGFIASPLYVSEASITIRSASQGATSFLENLVVAQDAIAGSAETQLVADYFQSRDMLAKVDADVGFRQRYADYNADFFSRMEPDISQEEAHDYFKKMVRVIDDGAGLLTLTVRAFSADDAVTIAQSAIRAAETMVNRLSDAAERDALATARGEVARAEKRLTAAADAVKAYQKASGDIDPAKTAEALLSVVAGLEAELANARIERATNSSYLRPSSPAIRAIDSKIAALQRQIKVERARLAANIDDTIADEVRRFESESLQKGLAEKAYESALASLEAARFSAQSRRSYLVAYAPPSTPDIAVEPRRMYKIGTVFVVSLLAFGIGALIVGAVREHARA